MNLWTEFYVPSPSASYIFTISIKY